MKSDVCMDSLEFHLDLAEAAIAFIGTIREVNREKQGLEFLYALREKSLIATLQNELRPLPPPYLLAHLEKRALDKRDEGSEETAHDLNVVRAFYATRFFISIVMLDKADGASR